eukprot:PhM_4_TR3071/c2_g2_i1/m.102532
MMDDFVVMEAIPEDHKWAYVTAWSFKKVRADEPDEDRDERVESELKHMFESAKQGARVSGLLRPRRDNNDLTADGTVRGLKQQLIDQEHRLQQVAEGYERELRELRLEQDRQRQEAREWDRRRGYEEAPDQQQMVQQIMDLLQQRPQGSGDPERELASTLQRILAERDTRIAVTDSEDEDACMRAHQRREKKVHRLVRSEDRYLYPQGAVQMSRSEFTTAWSMQYHEVKAKMSGNGQAYDDNRLLEIREQLKAAHRAMQTVSRGTGMQKRATAKVYQLLVDSFFLTATMIRVPESRYAAMTAFQKEGNGGADSGRRH